MMILSQKLTYWRMKNKGRILHDIDVEDDDSMGEDELDQVYHQ